MKKRSGFGWLEAAIGILLILIGIFTFVSPGKALTGMIFLYGIAAVVIGIADIVLYIRVEHYTGFGPVVSLISGILSVMSGMMLLVYPGAGVLVLSLLFPIWFIAHCISRLSHLNTIRLTAGNGLYYFTLVISIIGLILGILMICNPLFSISAVGAIAGLYLILHGINSLAVALSNMGGRR